MLDLEGILTLLAAIIFLGAICGAFLLYACFWISSDCSRREEEYEAEHRKRNPDATD